jgi:trimeric autotransporter adhesin
LASANAYTNQVGAQTLSSAKAYTETRAAETLTAAKTYTNEQVASVRGDMQRAVAQASALIAMAPSGTGETTINAGIASYYGKTAIGVSMAKQISDDLTINGGASFASGARALVRVGVGYRFK